MENKKNKVIAIIALIAVFLMVVVGTYAYFAPQTGGTTSKNATVTSNTTDLLTFSINRDINFTVTQSDFQINGNNKSGDATATATLVPNNKTGAATMNYYMYLNIENNDLDYTTEEPGYYVNTEALVPFSDTSDPLYEFKNFVSNEYIRLLNHIPRKLDVDEVGYLREVFESLDSEILATENSINNNEYRIYDFITQDVVTYNTSELPVDIEYDTDDPQVVVGEFNEDVINYLISLGWLRRVGNPELVLQVFDNNNNLVEIDDMGIQITTKGVTGYDITTKKGLVTLLNNHAISATNNTATIENWRVVLTLINLDNNQNENTGKEVSAELIIQKEPMNMGFNGTIYRNDEQYSLTGNPISDTPTNVWCYYDDSCPFPFMYEDDCGDFCVQQSMTLGVGDYETSLNDILDKDYTVYCAFDGTYCHSGFRYGSLDDCQGDVDQTYPGYTCLGETVNRNYYLKHEVVNNIIESTEVCLYYNNHEFCAGPNYFDTNLDITLQKLQADMENSLGTEADYCYVETGEFNHATCTFGDNYCTVELYSPVHCGSERTCQLGNDGLANCY